MILKPTHTMMAVEAGGGAGSSGTTSPLNPGEIAEENRTNPPDSYAPPPPVDETYYAPEEEVAGSGGTQDPVEGETTTDELMDMPGDHEVWKVDGVLYLVWFVPNTNPPLPIMYEVTDDVNVGELVVDRDLTMGDAKAMGGLVMGSARLVDRNDQHPIETFVDKWEDELKIKPWLEDPEIQAKMLAAYIEGRSMTLAELQTTEWWRTHTPEQRAWLAFLYSDPKGAEQKLQDNRIVVRRMLIEAGMDEPPDELVNLIADNATKGDWSAEYTNSQIIAITDPYSGIEVDQQIITWTTENQYTPNTTRTYEQQVRDLVARWLGPLFAAGWTEENIQAWAGEFRNNPDAEIELTEQLRQQRMVLYPGYTNENMTYEDIAATWRQFMMSQWGQAPDEMDPFFHQIVNLNDAGLASKLLRKEGMARGNATVVGKAINAFADAMGGAVVRSDPAVR